MRKKLSAAIREVAECQNKVFAIIMGVMSAYCWQLFTLFTTWFGIHTALPARTFIPTFQALVFCTPVFSILWCWKTARTMKKKGGWFKLARITFVIFLLCFIFGAISITGNRVRLWFWILAVVISVVATAIISIIFLKRKAAGQVSEASEEHEEESESEEGSEGEEEESESEEGSEGEEEESESEEGSEEGEEEAPSEEGDSDSEEEVDFSAYYGA